jgi:hypothetical protein
LRQAGEILRDGSVLPRRAQKDGPRPPRAKLSRAVVRKYLRLSFARANSLLPDRSLVAGSFRDGRGSARSEGGVRTCERMFEHGKLQSRAKTSWESVALETSATDIDGASERLSSDGFAGGKFCELGAFVQGLREGGWRTSNSYGRLLSEASYRADKLHGRSVEHDEQGTRRVECEYEDGLAHGERQSAATFGYVGGEQPIQGELRDRKRVGHMDLRERRRDVQRELDRHLGQRRVRRRLSALALPTLLACASCASWRVHDRPNVSVEPRYTAVEPAPAPAPKPTIVTDPPPVDPPVAPVVEPAAPAPVSASADTPADAPLVALLEGYYADFGARNWTAFAGHFWPGATIATIRKPTGAPRETVVVTLVDEYVTSASSAGANATPITIKLTARDVRRDGILAQVFARFDANVQAQGELHTWHGVDAFTLMKHDGEWRIASLVIGSNSFDD